MNSGKRMPRNEFRGSARSRGGQAAPEKPKIVAIFGRPLPTIRLGRLRILHEAVHFQMSSAAADVWGYTL
jgi:hypothetical protein